jgi:hypothetical protein
VSVTGRRVFIISISLGVIVNKHDASVLVWNPTNAVTLSAHVGW